MKYTLLICLLTSGVLFSYAQAPLRVEGNGRFQSAAGTTLDILSSDDNTNSLLRFGDNTTSKVSLGFNGNEDAFKIATASTLGPDDFSMNLSGLIGINALPGAHRFLLNHNSTSGLSGSAHLSLTENNSTDAARLAFSNLGGSGRWQLETSTEASNYRMNWMYANSSTFTTFLTLDGDNEYVGIHQTAPEGYLHIKQQNAGVDAIAIENDDATGGDKWSWRIGDEDILIYFNGSIRGGFDVSTGNYNNFPPAPALAGQSKYRGRVLQQLVQLEPLVKNESTQIPEALGFDPQQVLRINRDWVETSTDGQHLGLDYLELTILAIKAIQEQQELLAEQRERLDQVLARKKAQREELAALATAIDSAYKSR